MSKPAYAGQGPDMPVPRMVHQTTPGSSVAHDKTTQPYSADWGFEPFEPQFTRFKRFESNIDTNSNEFLENYKTMSALVKKLDEKLEDWEFQGAANRVERHHKLGKNLARDRLSMALDQDSPFLEIMPLVGQGHDGVQRGNPFVAGVGLISGVECVVCANQVTVGAGMNTVTGQKFLRMFQIAYENRLPFIQLLESPGADLSQQFKVFHGKPMAFYSMAQLSKAGIPSIAVVFGTCIAGGAYFAGMSDYCIMVRGNGNMALGGSKLVQVATGELSTDEEIGGAKMHAEVSGSAEFIAPDEPGAIRKCREIVSTFSYDKATLFRDAFAPQRLADEPFYNPDELLGIVNGARGHSNFDCREVMARVVDGSEMFEFKPLWGSTIVTAWAKLHGVPVGLIGNNGVIFPQSAAKGTHFINLCNQKGIPIIYFHNVTGFIVGKDSEAAGMLKWGAQMINAMSNVDVPNISIVIGSSFGAANYAMCGTGYYPRFIFSWPNAECAVMGPDQLSGVLELLARESAKRKGRAPDEKALAASTAMLKASVHKEMESFYTSSYGIDDGVIDPRDTRAVLGMCLSAVCIPKIDKGFIKGLARL